MQFKGKLMNQTLEMVKKLILGLILARFNPNLAPPIFFFVGFTSTKCYTLLEAIIICNFMEN